MSPDHIARRPDGSIDTEYYLNRAGGQRSTQAYAIIETVRGGLAWLVSLARHHGLANLSHRGD